MGRRIKFNEHYFDVIDDEHKAYWLGFLWSDGYLGYRIRDNGREEYNLKLSLTDSDYHHLEKFNNDLDGSYQVHFYNFGNKAFPSLTNKEARLFITNKHFGQTLREVYGIVPHREDFKKIENNVPCHLIKHLIRGIIDADGSFSKYNTVDRGYNIKKYQLQISGTISTIGYIEDYFIKTNLVNNTKRKYYKRHKEEDRDSGCRTLIFSGKNQVLKILNYLYDDSSIYLDRKYEKYLNIMEE